MSAPRSDFVDYSLSILAAAFFPEGAGRVANLALRDQTARRILSWPPGSRLGFLAVQGTPYIVMELLDGETLAQRLSQVGKAVSRAHDAGIVRWLATQARWLAPLALGLSACGGRAVESDGDTGGAAGAVGWTNDTGGAGGESGMGGVAGRAMSCSDGVAVMGIAAGPRHTCALMRGGGVRCWGSNMGGQLGDGSTTDRPAPPTSDVLTAVQAVAAGGYHTCTLMTGGGVRCWGDNGDLAGAASWCPMNLSQDSTCQPAHRWHSARSPASTAKIRGLRVPPPSSTTA